MWFRAAAGMVMVAGLFGCTGPTECGDTLCRAPGPVRIEIDGIPQRDLLEGEIIDVDLEYLNRDCVRRVPVTFTNFGHLAMSVMLTSSSSALVPPTTALELPPGEPVTSELLIGPHDADSFDATLGLSDATRFAAQVHLKGALWTTDVELPAPPDFGGVEVGFQSTMDRAAISGLSGDFSSAEASLTFAPKTVGPQRSIGTWDFLQSCPDLARVTVRGDGVSQLIAGLPTTLDFPSTPVGTSSERALKFGNLSFTPVSVSLGLTSPVFSIVSVTPVDSAIATRDAAGVLVAGETEVRLRFTPVDPVPYFGRFDVATSAPSTSPVRAVQLRAPGVP